MVYQRVHSPTGSGAANQHLMLSDAHEGQQRITPGEEAALLAWVLRLQAWGWPPRVEQVRSMANEILLMKDNKNPIGLN